MNDQVEVSTVALASAVTGYLLCDIGEVYEVIQQVTGVAPFTHQLPRMSRELAVHVRNSLPDFPGEAEASAYPVNKDTVAAFSAELIEQFGPTVLLPRQDVQARDPIKELTDMVGPERVLVARIGEDG